MPEKKRNLKIILSGIDNAGKSSLLKAFQKLYEYEQEVMELKPTIKIEHYQRNYLRGYILDIFDMGGQLKFRKRYLERKIYFADTDAFIYLIDSRKRDGFNESLEYLGKVLNILDELKYDKALPILVVFSKMDDNKKYKEPAEYLENIKYFMEEISGRFNSMGFKFEYFKSSIYNIFSVSRVFSAAINRFISEYEGLNNLMGDFGRKYNFLNVILFDRTGVIISKYDRDTTKTKIGPNNAAALLMNSEKETSMIDLIISSNLEFFAKVENKEDPNFKFFDKITEDLETYGYVFQSNNENFYVSIVSETSNLKKMDWDTFELIDKCKQIFEN
ncbi:MAG: ADP-ribosylation factor-like protein [Promethearchaeota archaeon]